jgi:alkylhydroperoxidase family enzyme
MSEPDISRLSNVVIQVFDRWMSGRDPDDCPEEFAAVADAAAAVFHVKLNDLDWEAATLRRLGYEGPVL